MPGSRLLAPLLAALVVSGGCGGDGSGEATTTTVIPTTVTAAPPATSATATTLLPDGGAVVPEGFARVVVWVTDDRGVAREWCFYVAATAAQRQRGLMEVTSLGDAAGMLFSYEQDASGPFYMYRTVLALTISWYASGGGFVSTTDMAPCESSDPSACPLYPPAGPYRYAIEVPQGTASTVGVVPGSRIAVTDVAC